MNLNGLTLFLQEYESPATRLLILEVEDTLAISNTESISEDPNKYGWD